MGENKKERGLATVVIALNKKREEIERVVVARATAHHLQGYNSTSTTSPHPASND